jgi:iron complex outermembrane receptor protein
MGNRFYTVLSATVAITSGLSAPAALAQEAGSDGIASNDIIVRARRIDERAQDVPISITVLSPEQLSKFNIVNSEDLAKYVPGLAANTRYSPEQSTFTIRGFTQELRTSSSVGTYFADVVAPRGGGANLSGGDGAGPAFLFDLQNVQVLKGPQGTLFGRNTTGGAVLLVPRKPVDRIEGYVEGSYGNYDMKRLQGVFNVPLSSSARLRFGFDRMDRDGYLHNVSGFGSKDYADVDYIAARASLVLDVTPSIENYTIVSYFQTDHMPAGYQTYSANTAVNGGAFGLFAVPQINRLNASGDRWQVELNLRNPEAYSKQWQVINTTSWTVSDALTLKNIASYSRIQQRVRTEIFGSNFQAPFTNLGALAGGYPSLPNSVVYSSLAFTPEGGWTSNQKNFTDELQVQGVAAGGKLNYQAGLYYENSAPASLVGSAGPSTGTLCSNALWSSPDELLCRSASPDPTRAATINLGEGSIKYVNMGAYAQGTYALTERLKLTAGIRYTYDRTWGRSIGKFRRFPFTFPASFAQAGPVVCDPGYTGPGCELLPRPKTSSKKPTWTLNLAYNPVEDVMLYGTWSRGYRQGSANPFAHILAMTFAPETVDSYELGAKTSFESGSISGQFNIAGYYNDLKNQQLQYALQPQPGTIGSNRTSIFNAGKSRIYGVEADAMLQIGGLLRLNGAVNYLRTKVISANTVSIPGYTAVPTAIAGSELAYSPRWSGSLTATARMPVPAAVGKIELGATYRFQSSYQSAAPTITSIRNTPVRQLDLNLTWEASDNAEIGLFANNVTNQFTVVTVNGVRDLLGFDSWQPGQPRMYGARLRIKFRQN